MGVVLDTTSAQESVYNTIYSNDFTIGQDSKLES
jgi:hypothetical protein